MQLHGPFLSCYPNGVRGDRGEYVAGVQQGLSESWYESGALKAQGPYERGKPHGSWRYLRESGALISSGAYQQGKEQARWAYYWPSGKLRAEGAYERGEPVGTWRLYGEDGALPSAIDPRTGTGLWQTFRFDGKLRATGKLVNGQREGEWKLWDDTGYRTEAAYCAGKLCGAWRHYASNDEYGYCHGELRMEAEYRDGVQHGEARAYHPDGRTLDSRGRYVQGKKEGLWTYWWGGGKKKGEGQFCTDAFCGRWTWWDSQGNLAQEGGHRNGKKHGDWKVRGDDGQVRTVRFDDGRQESDGAPR